MGRLRKVATLHAGDSNVEVWTDIQSLKKQVRNFGKDGVRSAQARASNKAAQKTKTFTGKLLQSEYNIKARSVSRKLKISPRASKTDPTTAIMGRSFRLSVYKHSKNKPKQTARGAKFNTGGGMAVHPHTFITTAPSSGLGVYIRADKTRRVVKQTDSGRVSSELPIRLLTYPTVGHMITEDDTATQMFKFYISDYPRQLHTQLDFELKKSKGVV